LEEKSNPPSGEIAIQPVRDVMVADVISGAPGASQTISYIPKMLMISQLSCVTVQFASTSRPEIPCNLDPANLNAGGLTGIFWRAVDDGKTPSWALLAREWNVLFLLTILSSTPNTRADYMQGTRVTFRSKEDAIHFAEKQGISHPTPS
jgi:NADH dehydrogenase (ubiquinone) Fe-S protein 4